MLMIDDGKLGFCVNHSKGKVELRNDNGIFVSDDDVHKFVLRFEKGRWSLKVDK